ncbi:hypothetical protein F3Y22_tig00110007pilonHSYRG00135 [Hibiscus syriacus]|uniref:Peptidase S8/S53 domain-containing protein n=1 Tax=Hibiscus syriacus TaxID=106335 RepID=A0A6A3BPS4_HIBSY|nr:hypothetical protein F3Y22_tig00110007pilonHSYRG00135 [Hibiscus syriacus]
MKEECDSSYWKDDLTLVYRAMLECDEATSVALWAIISGVQLGYLICLRGILCTHDKALGRGLKEARDSYFSDRTIGYLLELFMDHHHIRTHKHLFHNIPLWVWDAYIIHKWMSFYSNFKCVCSDTLAAMDVAIMDGFDVLSLSIGGFPLPHFDDSIAFGSFRAVEHGISGICAVGNSGSLQSSFANTTAWNSTIYVGTRQQGSNHSSDGQ